MIFEHNSYRSYLRQILVDRIRANPAYSLRAMAKQLQVSSSQLSEALNGKANFSLKTARRIAVELGLVATESEYFCLSVQFESEKAPHVRKHLMDQLNSLQPKKRKIHDLSLDVYRQISDWYHSAILEFVHLECQNLDPVHISRRLGISKIEAQSAIERLERLELIQEISPGKWIRTSHELQFQTPETSSALKSCYKQLMKKVGEALDEQPAFQERLGGYETMPMSADALPELNVAMEKFFTEMTSIAQKYPGKNQVYNLMVHMINLTSERKK